MLYTHLMLVLLVLELCLTSETQVLSYAVTVDVSYRYVGGIASVYHPKHAVLWLIVLVND